MARDCAYHLMTDTYAYGTRTLFLKGTHVWYAFLYKSARTVRIKV